MKPLSTYLFLFWGLFALVSCSKTSDSIPGSGVWRATLLREGHTLPFQLEITANPDGKTFTVFALNGAERLPMDTAYVEQDSLHIPNRLFESDLVAKVSGDRLVGEWRRYRVGKLVGSLPFEATLGQTHRFYPPSGATPPTTLAPKWSVVFRSATGEDSTVSVGLFEQKGAQVQGTFLTTTGDYRYLAGDLVGDSLLLSCFDGTHAFLFKAKLQPDGTLNGAFWSGVTGYETWTARPDSDAKLPDATTLTYLKPGYDRIDFEFPDADGRTLSLKDERFQNKVVIVQIMGSWCPNCMDETRFLAPWYKKNRTRGVEIVGLAYERSDKLEEAAPLMRRMADRYDVAYPILLAGKSDKTLAAQSLPMLNHIMSFPTTIIIDRKGRVRQIHTGFSGPGTGIYYDTYVEEFNRFMDKLLAE